MGSSPEQTSNQMKNQKPKKQLPWRVKEKHRFIWTPIPFLILFLFIIPFTLSALAPVIAFPHGPARHASALYFTVVATVSAWQKY